MSNTTLSSIRRFSTSFWLVSTLAALLGAAVITAGLFAVGVFRQAEAAPAASPKPALVAIKDTSAPGARNDYLSSTKKLILDRTDPSWTTIAAERAESAGQRNEDGTLTYGIYVKLCRYGDDIQVSPISEADLSARAKNDTVDGCLFEYYWVEHQPGNEPASRAAVLAAMTSEAEQELASTRP